MDPSPFAALTMTVPRGITQGTIPESHISGSNQQLNTSNDEGVFP